MNLCTFRFIRWSWTQTSAMGSSSHILCLCFLWLGQGGWGTWYWKLRKKNQSSSAFSRSWLSPVFFQRGHTFSLVFLLSPTYLQNLFLLLFPSLATHQGFSFPNLIPGCSDNFSVFFPGYLFFSSSSVGFLFVSWVCPGDPFSPTWAFQEFLRDFLFFWDSLLLGLGEVILEY